MSKSKKVVPTGFELVHLALPPGAKPGEGLGAKVLGALRNCDAILIVLRAFDDGGVEPDADGDLDALELELVMADLDERRAAARPAAPGGQERRQGDRGRGRARSNGARGRCRTARRSHRADLSADDLARARAGVPAHDEADARRAEHRREGRRPMCRSGDRRRSRGPIDIEAEIAACAPEDRAEMREMYGVGESALAHGRAGGVPPARPAHVPHDRRQTSRARGRSAPAPRRPSARA